MICWYGTGNRLEKIKNILNCEYLNENANLPLWDSLAIIDLDTPFLAWGIFAPVRK
jgi:hypothetical protein